MPPRALEQNHTDRQAQNTQYYLGVLHELVEMGMDLARVAHRQVLSQAEAVPQAPASFNPTPFDIITRSVRRSILLASKLSEPVAPHQTVDGKRIIRLIGPNGKAKDWDRDPAKLTDDELQELLEIGKREQAEAIDKENLDDLSDDASVADIIADICRDLGVDDLPETHPGKRRVVAGIARAATAMSRHVNASGAPPMPPKSPAASIPKVSLTMPYQPRPPGNKGTDPP